MRPRRSRDARGRAPAVLAASVTCKMAPRKSHSCDNAPWYTAPVIVGGSGGSGTRGVAMLLEALGVGMACLTKDFLMPAAQQNGETPCTDLKCNSAADCGLISSFRTGRAVGGHGAISWLRLGKRNGTASCDAVDENALHDALSRSVDGLCGGTKDEALRRLRDAVNPRYRAPLRWGLKNPHATYCKCARDSNLLTGHKRPLS